MKVTGLPLVLLCCVVYVSCHSRYRPSPRLPYPTYDSYRRRSAPGLTWDGQPCPVAGGCIQLPRQEDLLTRREFETQVVGRAYDAMYIIGKGTPMPPVHRQQTRYTVKGDLVVQDFRARLNETYCIIFPEYQYANFTSTTHAIMYNPGTLYLEPQGFVSPTAYFISEDPSQYIIVLTCLDTSSIRNGFCNGRYDVEITLTQSPPNNPPLKKIVDDLCTKLGLYMEDPGNVFHYIGEGCGLSNRK